MSEEEYAINVVEEGGRVYYARFSDLPEYLRKKISAEMLDNIFKKMVVPAIETVRKLDRVNR